MDNNIAQLLQQKSRELYDLCDEEKKGFITKRDMQRMTQYIPLDPTQLEGVFDSLDDDGNGYLSFEEFSSGFQHFIGGDESINPQPTPKKPLCSKNSICYNPHGDTILGDRDDDEELEYEEQQFQQTLHHLGAEGLFTDVESVRDLWAKLRKDNPDLVPGLEALLSRVSSEMSKTQTEYKSLESILKTKSSAHEEEVRRLYEEMENQMKLEREQLLADEKLKEKQIKELLEQEILEKDKQYHDLMKRQEETITKLNELKSVHTETAEEKENLQRERDGLEHRLMETEDNLGDCQEYIDDLNKKSKDERRKRAKATLEMSEGIALERETLVRELEMLRDMNKKLKDDRDEKLLLLQMREQGSEDGETIDFDSPDGVGHGGRKGSRRGKPDDDVEHSQSNNLLPNGARAEKRGSYLSSYFTSGNNISIEEDDDDYFEIAAVTTSPEGLGSPSGRSEVQIQTDESDLTPIGTQDLLSNRSAPDGALEDNNTENANPPFSPVSPQRMYKIVFVGDSGVGKSSIIYRFCHNDFRSSFCSTIGVDFQLKSVQLERNTVALQLWDTAGQERFRSITRQYYRKADGIVIVYDVTNVKSFLNVREWIDCIEDDNIALGKIIILILANKCDVDPEQKAVSTEQGQKLAKDYNALFFEVSAKTGDTVKEAFFKMTGNLKTKEDWDICNAFQIQEEKISLLKKSGCCK